MSSAVLLGKQPAAAVVSDAVSGLSELLRQLAEDGCAQKYVGGKYDIKVGP